MANTNLNVDLRILGQHIGWEIGSCREQILAANTRLSGKTALEIAKSAHVLQDLVRFETTLGVLQEIQDRLQSDGEDAESKARWVHRYATDLLERARRTRVYPGFENAYESAVRDARAEIGADFFRWMFVKSE